MPKKKDKDGVEFWRSKCRGLEKQVRQLEKLVTQGNKRSHIYNDVINSHAELLEMVETTQTEPDLPKCDVCSTGYMAPKVEFIDKVICECTECGVRRSVKKLDI